MKEEKVHIGNSFVNNTAQRLWCPLKSCQVLTVTHMVENNFCIFFNGVQNIHVMNQMEKAGRAHSYLH